ncbi:class I SAM-dependent methyltransferase [Methanofollis formosanus]|uniref:Class I SAM-dependent methyltransferase n=1 Tax=Methanofollis formosanus TaxID=299308 RepID=A0A8G1A484_9EURY|nr:class I SAM-dependent methyltransferase [Methanofollis formosanus]QYZ80156.1 class I SAM-dependent methyltransferase [Methanofollis formosanus]
MTQIQRFRDGTGLKEALVQAMDRLEEAGLVYPAGHRERVLEQYTLKNVPYPYIVLRVGEPRITRHFFYSEAVKHRGEFLDYGCGTGDAVRHLLRDGYPREMVRGFDLTWQSIDLGMDLYADREEVRDLFLVDDRFPFRSERFETVYSGSVFHVIEDEDEFREYLMCAHDALKPGGIFFGSTLGLRDGVGARSRAGPPRLMTRDEMAGHMAAAGFREVTVREGDRTGMPGAAPDFCVFEFSARKPAHR